MLDGKTPYEKRHGKKPHLAGIQEFGAAAYVKDLTAGKLDARAQVRHFVGYYFESKGYRIYWPHKRSITVERNVVFNENDVLTTDDVVVIPGDILAEGERDKVIQNAETTLATPNNTTSEPKAEESEPTPIDVPDLPVEPTSDQDTLPESLRPSGPHPRKLPGAYKALHHGTTPLTANVATLNDLEDNSHYTTLDDEDEYPDLPLDFFTLHTQMGSEPRKLDKVLRGPNAKEWQAAYDYEISQLIKMGVFTVEDLPEGEPVLPYSLVFREKLGPDGNINSWRVRLVAGGHKQSKGVNYDETFSSAAKSPAVRVVLGHAAAKDWEIDQVDMKSVYLYAPLKGKIYMKLPPGILKPGQEGKVV